MSDHKRIMNKAAFTALIALTISLVFCTACVSKKNAAEREVSAADETTAGIVPEKRGSSGTEGKGQNGSERTAGERILEKAGKTAAETAAEAVTGKNEMADENEKEDEAQQSLSDDHMERQENSQEQIWESEDSEKDDREEKEEDDAFKEMGDSPEEEEHESAHVHDWAEQTKIIHHDETGHFEEVKTGTRTVVDEEAYDEPVYQMKCICSACGYEADSVDEISSHMDSHYDPQLGYIDASYSVQEVVTDVIRHPESSHEEPVFEKQWIVDSEAWDETVVTGYRCSTCGAVK